MTRAELMRHALSQALRRVHIGPKKLKLDEETRWQIAWRMSSARVMVVPFASQFAWNIFCMIVP